MERKLTRSYTFFILLIAIFTSSCKKYLEAKPDTRLSTPSTLADIQAILDNINIMNAALFLTNNSTDEYYLDEPDWSSLPEPWYHSYIWEVQAHPDESNDWITQYRTVFYANTVLDDLKKISPRGQEQKWNNSKGAALFFRAYSFYQLAQLYAKQYDPNTAASDLGIPLRLNSNFNNPTTRSTVQQAYDQIIRDLGEALTLLPANTLPNSPENKTRPTWPGTFALLARTYLQMGDYAKAKENANQCLQLYSVLLDYNNDINPSDFNPFPRFNSEVIFYTNTEDAINIFDFMAKADSSIYNSYASDDLRKEAFFEDNGNGSFAFEGSYNGSGYELFNGIATDEVYLIRAETFARLGDHDNAMKDLNTLLKKRWATGKFTDLKATNPDDALTQILQERKKELLNRGTRWSDLKRLNKDPRFAVTLKRVLNGQTYTLPPNDPRYTLLIPRDVIQLTGIQQNPR